MTRAEFEKMAKGMYGHMSGITPATKKCSMAFFCMSCPFSPKKVLLSSCA
jgi:hypothetical protein